MADYPPVAALRSFEAVARLGSVTQAAQELHVSHSAVSQHLKSLELQVGVKLFNRHGRGLLINEEGRLYALHVRDALQRIAEATRLVQARPRVAEVTLALVPSFGSHWLIPRLPRFRARCPHITLRLIAGLTLNDLPQQGIDVAIRMGKGDWEGLQSQLLFRDEYVVVAAPHFNGGVLPHTPQAIVDSALIFSMESWQAWCDKAGIAAPPARRGLCINDSNLLLEAVRLGQGIALERRSVVQAAIQRGELVQLSPVSVAYPWPYWLVTTPDRDSDARRELIGWLQEEAASYLQLTEPWQAGSHADA